MSPLKKIRITLIFFMAALVASGVTAIPIESELTWLLKFQNHIPTGMADWLKSCRQAIAYTNLHYPMVAYGFDWLAFAHVVIAIVFVGPYRDPVKNVWVIDWGIIACVLIVPTAFIFGPMRGIPVFHLLIDTLFGIFGVVPLLCCKRWIKAMEARNCGIISAFER